MLHSRCRIAHVDVWKCVRSALLADQQRVALGVISCAGRSLHDLYQAAIGILAVAGGNTLGHDRAARVLSQMNHLGAGIGLLVIIGESD